MIQGVEALNEMSETHITIRDIGKFIKWIYNDIIKEELDTMKASGIEPKDKNLNKGLSRKTSVWFGKHLDNIAFNSNKCVSYTPVTDRGDCRKCYLPINSHN